MSNELPGEWGKLLGPKGLHSYRDVAAKVGISAGTAHRLMNRGATSSATVNKIADALFSGDRDLVWRLYGSDRRDHGDWALPAEASLLDEEQRAAILNLIQVMVPKVEPVTPAKRPDERALRRAAEALKRQRQVATQDQGPEHEERPDTAESG